MTDRATLDPDEGSSDDFGTFHAEIQANGPRDQLEQFKLRLHTFISRAKRNRQSQLQVKFVAERTDYTKRAS
jgi:hypothetical protein